MRSRLERGGEEGWHAVDSAWWTGGGWASYRDRGREVQGWGVRWDGRALVLFALVLVLVVVGALLYGSVHDLHLWMCGL